jgi:hypothetical protein
VKRSIKTSRSGTSPAFEADYLDIDHWPHRWRVEPKNLRPGERMLDVFKLFLAELLTQGLAVKTLRLHRDHLCDLGGEIIRRLNLSPELRKQPITKVLRESIDEDGGPLMYPRRSEPEQRSFDATCRRLHHFLMPAAS